jgi:tripartite ATP-independent transporter DctM subunit
MTLVILFGLLVLFIAFGVPIAIALAAVSVIAMVLTSGITDLPNIGLILFDGATGFALITIPLFILAGAIMNACGISRRLIGLASAIFGSIRGALGLVTVGSLTFLAEVSGSAVASVAAVGSIVIPAMKERGYPVPFAAAITSSSSTLAVVLPPSIPMILYAVMSGTSVVELFVAGFVPGFLGAAMMMGIAYWVAVKHNLPKEFEAFQLSRLWRAFKDAAWALLLPVIVLGGIFSGWVTATEGAGLAVFAALFLGTVVYRELDFKILKAAALEGGSQTAVVMLLVATSAVLGDFLTSLQAPQAVATAITNLTTSPWLILLLLNIFFLVVGTFLHAAAAIILVVPIVMPLITAVGIDPIHFGIIVTLNLAIGQQTPPVASVLITACSVAKADLWSVSKANVPFLITLLILLVVMTYVPALPLALVNIFYH